MKKHLVQGISIITAFLIMAGNTLAADVYIRKTDEKLGWFITDENGMTLYTFKKDTPGKSVCGAANDCIKNWPAFYADQVDAEVPLTNKDFTTITRADEKKQTTYKGMPLYYFIKDTKAGDTNGQGVNSIWFVTKP